MFGYTPEQTGWYPEDDEDEPVVLTQAQLWKLHTEAEALTDTLVNMFNSYVPRYSLDKIERVLILSERRMERRWTAALANEEALYE